MRVHLQVTADVVGVFLVDIFGFEICYTLIMSQSLMSLTVSTCDGQQRSGVCCTERSALVKKWYSRNSLKAFMVCVCVCVCPGL